MDHGSESRRPSAEPGTRSIALRCMFCGRKQMTKECYSAERIYPPGQSTFGITVKCPKCGMTTRF